ncbi:MAG: hypothetical protein H0Z32_14935 [Bacillaceae bacterium]|nr:hypothetical protein [Bacillaceae bacterium]
MNLINLKNQLSIQSKNGIPFLLSGTLIWLLITLIYLQPLDIREKNMFLLFSTGLMFPVSILIATLIKADWKNNDHPLGKLGLYLNLAQLVYFPIIIWAFSNSPFQMILFFAVITGAHFFPYGWLYHTKAFYWMAPVTSIGISIIGWNLDADNLWVLPFAMVIFLLILVAWLYFDYKKKSALNK